MGLNTIDKCQTSKILSVASVKTHCYELRHFSS